MTSKRFSSSLALGVFVGALVLQGHIHAQSLVPAATPPGGFVELATSTASRTPLTSAQIQALLPARGPFTFPAPYGTQGVRLTNGTDCAGTDCVYSVGYSYWRNMNNHVGSDTILIMLTLNRSQGGPGPSLFSYNKVTGDTKNVGPLFAASSPFSWATGEGWYFSATRPKALYANLPGGSAFYRIDVLARTAELVFDTAAQFGADKYIWQLNSSTDDTVHSFTLRSHANDAMLGCGVFNETTQKYSYFPAVGVFDECQIDKSGRYLVIKEKTGLGHGNDDDNMIEDLQAGTETLFLDEAGAPGHSDNGFGYIVGEDNWYSLPGAARLWNLGAALPTQSGQNLAGQGTLVYHLLDWTTGLGHITHTNATTGARASQYACASNASRTNAPRVNELVCFTLDGSLRSVIVAPNMVDLNAAGGSTDYWRLPKANLDVTGEYMIWTANQGGARQDAFLVRVPSQLLRAPNGSDQTPPAVAVASPSAGTTVSGSVTVSATASDNVGVVGVTFWLDGIALGAEVSAPPYSVTWNTSGAVSGSHVLTASARDAAGNTSTSQPVTVTLADVVKIGGWPTPVAVQWTNIVNATATGGTLQKTSGCSSCADAGGVSQQQIASGDGYVEFTTTEVATLRAAGLSHVNPGTTLAGIVYGLRIQQGTAEVREAGTYRGDTRAAAGDVFRVAIVGGKVQYSKNGTVFYTSSVAPVYPLLADASLSDANTAIVNAVLSSGSATAPSATSAPAVASAGAAAAVAWTGLVNTTVTGSVLQKTGGCDGCADAGAVSQQQIASGDGYVEFTATEVTRLRAAGLSRPNPGTTLAGILYGLRIQQGLAEVRESGTYRGDTRAVAGDVFRVAIVGGKVRYSKNGTVFYTSTLAPVYPLLADASFTDASAAIANALIAPSTSSPTVSTQTSAPVAITWTTLVNMTVNGSVLQKTTGCDGCADAGAVSLQQIPSGDGYLEFAATETSTLRAIGLGRGDPGTSLAEIGFAIRLQGGTAEVREAGIYRADTSFLPGDLFRVAVAGGTVTYLKNGSAFYRSAVVPTYPLLADTSFIDLKSTISSATLLKTGG